MIFARLGKALSEALSDALGGALGEALGEALGKALGKALGLKDGLEVFSFLPFFLSLLFKLSCVAGKDSHHSTVNKYHDCLSSGSTR